MESILVKIFATALALSQVTTAPEAVKTQFDRTNDQAQVTQLLRDGCGHIKKVFDIERINLDDLIATALDDSQTIAKENKVFRHINFVDLQAAYRQFCTDQKIPVPAIDVGDVIDSYNKAMVGLPDPDTLKSKNLPGSSVLLDGKGQPFAEVSDRNQRRIWVPLTDIPKHVQLAFIAAEDQHFYEHKGIDERGLIRAFISNLARSSGLQGGSTITQQVVKNLLVGGDRTYERKIREIILATRVERTLSKDDILELYLNAIYFGRRSWGIEMAARTYFGKHAKELTIEEGALLAGMAKGPNYFSPYRHPARAQQRLSYVLRRLKQDQLLPGLQLGRALPELPKLTAYSRARRNIGFYFVDQIERETKSLAGIDALSSGAYTVHSTINQELQRSVEQALQEGLSRYERVNGRAEFKSPEANLAKAIERAEANQPVDDARPAWQRVLTRVRLPLYDVHWEPAVVLETSGGKRGAWRVGLSDGRIMPLTRGGADMQHELALYDVVLVHVSEARRKRGAWAELRARPEVEGAVVVIENKTGRILAMTGGFSYPLSQLNRATQSVRQPGSTIKPLVYLAALGAGLQPNTLVKDESLTLPPVGARQASQENSWTPKNYGGNSGGVLTLRRALENSRNLATVHLLLGGIEKTPEESLNRVCDLAREAQIYSECARYYPFVLGAQPVRPVNLAAFYASIANEGMRPTPHVVDRIEGEDGQVVYRNEQTPSHINSVDHAAYYQLKTILQGVLARGTARAIAHLSPYVAGKTGTSDDENDAWFVGFTNDVTVAVWTGYDNADGKRRTLGGGSTGGAVAVPIFEPVIQAVWADVAPKAKLAQPSPQAARELRCRSIDYGSGSLRGRGRGRGGFFECFRATAKGRVQDTQYLLLSGRSVQAKWDPDVRRSNRSATENETPRAKTTREASEPRERKRVSRRSRNRRGDDASDKRARAKEAGDSRANARNRRARARDNRARQASRARARQASRARARQTNQAYNPYGWGNSWGRWGWQQQQQQQQYRQSYTWGRWR